MRDRMDGWMGVWGVAPSLDWIMPRHFGMREWLYHLYARTHMHTGITSLNSSPVLQEGERSDSVLGYAPKNYHLTCKVRPFVSPVRWSRPPLSFSNSPNCISNEMRACVCICKGAVQGPCLHQISPPPNTRPNNPTPPPPNAHTHSTATRPSPARTRCGTSSCTPSSGSSTSHTPPSSRRSRACRPPPPTPKTPPPPPPPSRPHRPRAGWRPS
jgi:hypothetical protein